MKNCKQCGHLFHRPANAKYCNPCAEKRKVTKAKEWKRRNYKPAKKTEKVCDRCGELYKTHQVERGKYCQECVVITNTERSKVYYENNLEKVKRIQKEYRETKGAEVQERYRKKKEREKLIARLRSMR